MRARLIVVASLLSLVLAGCADAPEPVTESEPELPLVDAVGLNTVHPVGGYLTNAALPVAPEPGMINSVNDDGTITWYKPAYKGIPDILRGIDPVANLAGVAGGGHGIAVFGSLVFTGGTGGPLNIVDISIPEDPKIIGKNDDTPVRDADTILFPDGRLILISTAGGGSMFATNVTDPTNPVLIGQIETSSNNHNIVVVPGTHYAYNTGSGDRIDIIDWSDPENPVEIGQFINGQRCHDIAMHIDVEADKYWAICAGYAESEIWDVRDPTAPEMIVEIAYPSAEKGIPVVGDASPIPDDGTVPRFPGSFSHLAILNHDATVLIMGDETNGGSANRCDFYYEGPDGTTYSGPIGNLWFYDITDPQNPDLRGHVSPGYADAEGSCTAHFGKVIGDTDYLVMAFYSAGVTLVDFQDLDNPKITDRWDAGGNIWDVWFHQGYLFTGDMNRGMDVLSLS